MKKKRIVVTGMGVVSAFGNEVSSYYDKLLKGESAVFRIDTFPCDDYPTRIAGFIRNFDPGDYISKKLARRIDPFCAYGIVAGKKALEQSKLESYDPMRVGVVIGSGMGGMSVFYEGVKTLVEKGYRRLTPFFVPTIITNMAGALLAIDKNFQGPNYSVSTACATANFAILAAAEEILQGHADIMVCGGAEASINPMGLAGFIVSKALSTQNDEPKKASKPWDKKRDGFVMGEGAGVLVLESLDHALARKAPIFAEFLGGSKNCDAYHMTEPREDGEVVGRCMEDAIKDANLTPKEICYINAHATSTLAGDLCEIRAIKKVFAHGNFKMNATKSMIGHCLGAAGGMEAIATIMAIKTGLLHPTINLEDPEEDVLDLDIVRTATKWKAGPALSNSFGFGGHNASLVFAPYR